MSKKKWLLLLAILVVVLAASIGALWWDGSSKAKKVIQWGWGEPDTKFMRENIEQMNAHPFDGLIFHVTSNTGTMLMWDAFGGPKHELAEFQHAIDDLKATRFRRLKHRFLRVNVTPGDIDWFDDQSWGPVLHNCGLSAQIAWQGSCKGFMFDTEQYGSQLFDYGKQKRRDTKSFAEYQVQVRARGREWIQTVNAQFPNITILLSFGYEVARHDDKEPAQEPYGLYASFLDGILDACSRKTKIIDGYEFAYGYKTAEQFQEGYRTMREKALPWTQAPDKYRQHVSAGFGLWLDNNSGENGWQTDDFSKNYFSPQEFKNALYSALTCSDEYVWVYSEKPRWWTNEQLPEAYVTAFRQAIEQAAAEQSK